MGAGVSTEGAPLTRVKCKNNLGVLFDHEAEEAFLTRVEGGMDDFGKGAGADGGDATNEDDDDGRRRRGPQVQQCAQQ